MRWINCSNGKKINVTIIACIAALFDWCYAVLISCNWDGSNWNTQWASYKDKPLQLKPAVQKLAKNSNMKYFLD